jgi:predicted RNA-binding protein with RPS1 domain|tara:strand:- start:1752 stop:2312 length:561 start_codon:yes stop_codon:yes gene_type:complete
MRFSKEHFYEKYRMLPKDIKKAIHSLNINDIIKSITDRHRLHMDTTGILDDEIMYAIIGITKVSDFIKNIKAQTNLPDEKVNAIAKDVNEKIFLPIRKLMMELTQKSEIKAQQGQKQNTIHHPPLTASEEIKKQIREQREIKPVSAPPQNLPTQPDTPKEKSDLGAELPSEPKKPTHVDPYREPIE